MSKSAILNYRKKHRPTCSYSIRLLKRLEEFNEIKKNEKPLWGEVNRYKPLDFDLIEKAICFSKKYHDGQFRKSGEPFYTHPLEVAYLITDYNMTTNVIVTSILHDVVEDSIATVGMIVDNFGFRIAEMVDMLTTDDLKKVYKIFCEDKEVALIKLMDRKHNLSTLKHMPKNKAIKKIEDSYKSCFLGIAGEKSLKLEKEFCLLLGKEVKLPLFDYDSFSVPKLF